MRAHWKTLLVTAILPLNTLAAPAPAAQTCPAGEHWVQAHHRNGYIRGDGVAVSATDVVAHCHPNPPTYSVWKDKLLNGLPPGWELKSEKSKPWTIAERERILEALALLPPALLNLPIKGIYRGVRSSLDNANPASGNAGAIVIYDPAFMDKENLSRILAHELAHEEYRQLSDADRRNYSETAQWKTRQTPSGKQILVPMRESFSEEDRLESPGEDFSNNIEHHLYKPDALNSANPQISNWIRERYGDKFKVGGGRNP